jgi:hypothetical protein
MTETNVTVVPEEGIFRTFCEMEDTPDPEVKIFRFKEWPGKFPDAPYYPAGIKNDGSGPRGRLRYINAYSYWNSDFDIGKVVGRYRVTAQLDAPPGYVGAYEATTKPEAKPEVVVSEAAGNDAERTRLTAIEDKIVSCLEKGGRMVLSALKRKTHAYRFGEDWEKCLQNLTEQGELETKTDDAGRVWVNTTTAVT